jgi:hypothetical protein
MRARILTTLGCLALLATGCGDTFDPASQLNSYRLLSIDTAPVIAPTATLNAAAVDFAPPGVERAPTLWRLCPYSFGASAEYACLVPEAELVFEGEALSVDLATAQFGDYVGLEAALEPAAAALQVQAERFGLDSISAQMLLQFGVDLVVSIESGPADARITSVRLVRAVAEQAQQCSAARQLQTICSSGQAPEGVPCGDVDYQVTALCETEANANPSLEALEVVELEDGPATPGAELTLRVTPGADARQVYYNANPDALCPSDGSSTVSGGPCTEQLYYRWYTSAGELEQSITLDSDQITDRDTKLNLPADATGPVTVFVVAYDGRGGVAALQQTFEIGAGN